MSLYNIMDSDEDIDFEKEIRKIRQEKIQTYFKCLFSILILFLIGISLFVYRWMGSRTGEGDKNSISICIGIVLVNAVVIGTYNLFCFKKKYKAKKGIITKTETINSNKYKIYHLVLSILSIPVYFCIIVILYKLFFSQYLLSVIMGGITAWLMFIGSLFEGYKKYYSEKSENSKKAK